MTQAGDHLVESLLEGVSGGESPQQTPSGFAHGSDGLDETFIQVMASGQDARAMLDHNRQQLGIELTQHAPVMARAPVIQSQMGFPQLENQLNLPA